MAVGVVYMSCDQAKWDEWNDELVSNLEAEITELKGEGAQVVVLGHLNAHFEKDQNPPHKYKPMGEAKLRPGCQMENGFKI